MEPSVSIEFSFDTPQKYRMKLKMILEVQFKTPSTNMDRTNCLRQLSAGSINDLYHHVFKTRVFGGTKETKEKQKESFGIQQ